MSTVSVSRSPLAKNIGTSSARLFHHKAILFGYALLRVSVARAATMETRSSRNRDLQGVRLGRRFARWRPVTRDHYAAMAIAHHLEYVCRAIGQPRNGVCVPSGGLSGGHPNRAVAAAACGLTRVANRVVPCAYRKRHIQRYLPVLRKHGILSAMAA